MNIQLLGLPLLLQKLVARTGGLGYSLKETVQHNYNSQECVVL